MSPNTGWDDLGPRSTESNWSSWISGDQGKGWR